VALLAAALAAFLAPYMGSAVNIALPAIGREFGANPVLLGWISTAYLLAAAVAVVPLGRLADLTGRKRMFQVGVAGYTAASLLCALAPSVPVLVAARVLQGVGGAMIFGTGTAILVSVFPAEQRGRVLGISVASTYTGLSLGPFLGGWLTTALGWRAVFYLNVPLGLAIVGLVAWKLEGEWAEARGESFDLAGSALYVVMLLALLAGLARLPRPSGAGLLLLGLAALAAFVRLELGVPSPVLDMSLFRKNPVFAFSNLAALINYAATFAVGFLLSLDLQYARGFSPAGAGLILVAQPVTMAVVSPFAGRLSDRVEPRVLASLGMALSALGLAALAAVGGGTSTGFVVASLVVFGLGFGLFSSPNTNAVMSAVAPRQYGIDRKSVV
jgi:EmrB/QacA subfamily drug resistance transporter